MPSTHLPTASSFLARAIAFVAAVGVAQAQAGDLDLSLNGGQLVTTQLSTSTGQSMRAQGIHAANGKVLVVGQSESANGNRGWSVIRYEDDGDLDTSFAGDGRVELFHSPLNPRAQDVVVYPDGRILVVGDYHVANNQGGSWQFGVVRLHDNGSLDTSFGTGGIARVSFGNNRIDNARAVALQSDNRIVVGGTSRTSNSASLVLARLTASGQLDSTFGKGGKSTPLVSVSGSWGPQYLWLQPGCMALDGAGRIVVGGAGQSSSGAWRIARYTTAGKLDGSFGSGGIVTDTLASSVLYDVDIAPSGQVIAIGTFNDAGRAETAAVRYLANGARDSNFGIGGLASTIGCAALPSGIEYRGSACRVQSDGKIVLGGYTLDVATWSLYMTPFRFAADGSRDTSFGVDGLGQPANLGPSSHFQGFSIAFDDQDRLVIGGGDNSTASGSASVAWMRWL